MKINLIFVCFSAPGILEVAEADCFIENLKEKYVDKIIKITNIIKVYWWFLKIPILGFVPRIQPNILPSYIAGIL